MFITDDFLAAAAATKKISNLLGRQQVEVRGHDERGQTARHVPSGKSHIMTSPLGIVVESVD